MTKYGQKMANYQSSIFRFFFSKIKKKMETEKYVNYVVAFDPIAI